MAIVSYGAEGTADHVMFFFIVCLFLIFVRISEMNIALWLSYVVQIKKLKQWLEHAWETQKDDLFLKM